MNDSSIAPIRETWKLEHLYLNPVSASTSMDFSDFFRQELSEFSPDGRLVATSKSINTTNISINHLG
jgi:hypothetical protein